jgi:hypothetical protein
MAILNSPRFTPPPFFFATLIFILVGKKCNYFLPVLPRELMNARTSRSEGIDVWAPNRLTHSAAA